MYYGGALQEAPNQNPGSRVFLQVAPIFHRFARCSSDLETQCASGSLTGNAFSPFAISCQQNCVCIEVV